MARTYDVVPTCSPTIPVTQVPLGGRNEEEKRNESIEKDETIKTRF